MLVISGTVPIKPEQHDAAVAAAVAVQTGTRQEPGNTKYQFSFASDDPNLICIFEEWEDEAALANHFTTPHIAAFRAVFGDITAGPGTFLKYQVSSTGPVF
jgi:quinol monooxygenase YgiN